jgi:hypothetical protein
MSTYCDEQPQQQHVLMTAAASAATHLHLLSHSQDREYLGYGYQII